MNRFALLPLFFFAASLLLAASSSAQTVSPLDEARAALKANDVAKAAALLEPLTGADAKDAAAFHTLSQVRLAQKRPAEAIAAAEKATTLDATQPAYFSQLGMAYGQRMSEVPFTQQATMSVKLKKAFAKAVELDPNDLTGLIGLARFYVNAPEIAGGSPEKAKEFAGRVQRIDPFLGELELGNIANRDDQPAEALAHYEAAAKLKPAHAGALTSCGQMLAKLGKKDEARARFEAALKINPASEAAKKGLAGLEAPAP
jgi:tetratricopeptide (TPR) repeat protein